MVIAQISVAFEYKISTATPFTFLVLDCAGFLLTLGQPLETIFEPRKPIIQKIWLEILDLTDSVIQYH